VAGVLLASVAFASPASAHDPIILTPAQTTPEAGPLLLDGTISFALYGTVDAPGVTRGFRVRFASGDTFTLSALVPDLPPESSLTSEEFPRISVQSPSGEDIELEPGTVTTFDEPFTKTRYRRYLEWSAPAEAGVYGVTVTGVVPARFTVSVGVQERFGTPVEDVPNRALGVGGVLAWYRTPPPVATTTAPVDGGTGGDATAGVGSASGSGPAVLVGAVVVGLVAIGSTFVAVRRRRTRSGGRRSA
jgi:hypothetical protein